MVIHLYVGMIFDFWNICAVWDQSWTRGTGVVFARRNGFYYPKVYVSGFGTFKNSPPTSRKIEAIEMLGRRLSTFVIEELLISESLC